MYVISWRTVNALTRVLFWGLFPELSNVCTLVTNCLCTHSSVILGFISLVAVQLSRERLNSSQLEYIHYSKYCGGKWRVDKPEGSLTFQSK